MQLQPRLHARPTTSPRTQRTHCATLPSPAVPDADRACEQFARWCSRRVLSRRCLKVAIHSMPHRAGTRVPLRLGPHVRRLPVQPHPNYGSSWRPTPLPGWTAKLRQQDNIRTFSPMTEQSSKHTWRPLSRRVLRYGAPPQPRLPQTNGPLRRVQPGPAFPPSVRMQFPRLVCFNRRACSQADAGPYPARQAGNLLPRASQHAAAFLEHRFTTSSFATSIRPSRPSSALTTARLYLYSA